MRGMIVVCFIVIPTTFGCGSAKSTAERIAFSIEEVEKWPEATELNRFTKTQTLAGLRSATPDKLKEPKISVAWVNDNPDGKRRSIIDFTIVWIENEPTIDAIEMRLPSGESETINFDEARLESNRAEAKAWVLCSYIGKTDRASPTGKFLGAAIAGRKLEFLLLSNGKAVASTRRVEFFRAFRRSD